jgi:alpha-ribazole phosphatase
MLHLYLVRHGQTDWNAQQRYQGHSDLPLNQTGSQQARQLAERLQAQTFDIVLSSDLQRALQTAEILIGSRQIKLQPDPRLREMNFGMLEGHTFDQARERWPEIITKWLADYNQPPEGGERIDEFELRVSRFYTELRQSYAEKTVLIVAHGGSLREIIRRLLGTPSGPARWFSLEHASLTEAQIFPAQDLEQAESIIINRLNDVGHLKTS